MRTLSIIADGSTFAVTADSSPAFTIDDCSIACSDPVADCVELTSSTATISNTLITAPMGGIRGASSSQVTISGSTITVSGGAIPIAVISLDNCQVNSAAAAIDAGFQAVVRLFNNTSLTAAAGYSVISLTYVASIYDIENTICR